MAGPGNVLTQNQPRFKDVWALSKPRVTLLVWATTLFGLVLGGGLSLSPLLVINTLIGSWFVIASANALNQVLEAVPDSKMKRTSLRPIPAGRLSGMQGLMVGLAWGIIGVSQLAIFVNLETAGLGVASILLYVVAYTLLKPRTHLATAVGAIPGAIPPLAGFVAATGRFDLQGILLFAIQFFWQFPHFWSIAWILREDYSNAGFKMLPYPNADGKATGLCSLQSSIPLIPLSLMYGTYLEYSIVYWIGASILGVWLCFTSYRFYKSPEDFAAKKLLRVSVSYLPLILILMICTR